MKTNHSFTIALLLLGTTSCSTYYRMTSRIESDGSMYREVYAQGDSTFMAGVKSHNPFLFQIDTNWQILPLDSTMKFNFWEEEENLNVKVCGRFPVIDGEYFSAAQGKEHMSSLAIPTERLKKSFRWFYTYYTYTAFYKELPDKGPIPLDNYMSKEEQAIWFCGDNNAYNGLNGIELNNELDRIEEKFGEWYSRSQYEINVEVIRHFASMQGDTLYTNFPDKYKNTVYKNLFSRKGMPADVGTDDICSFFDKVCQTNFYSELYETNKEAMDNMCEEKNKIAEVLYHAIQFELTMPGKLLSSNARSINNNSVIWKVDGFRLLGGNYALTAESRTINYWAFGVTLLIILAALGIFIRLHKRHS